MIGVLRPYKEFRKSFWLCFALIFFPFFQVKMLNIVTEKQEQAIKDKVSEVLLSMTPNKDFVSYF